MSKKTRKKSSNTTGKPAATKVARARSASTGKSATKTRTTVAKKAASKKASEQAAKTAKAKTAAGVQVKASHKAASKPLKPEPAATVIKSSAVTLAEGAAAPGFDLPRDGGGRVSLKDFAGKKLVLFFYPRADTPGCTREAIDFTRLKGEFAAYQPIRLRRRSHFETNTSCRCRWPRTPPMRCSRHTVPGAKNPCMAGPSWELFAPRFWSIPVEKSPGSGAM
jgi:hypothetical protein